MCCKKNKKICRCLFIPRIIESSICQLFSSKAQFFLIQFQARCCGKAFSLIQIQMSRPVRDFINVFLMPSLRCFSSQISHLKINHLHCNLMRYNGKASGEKIKILLIWTYQSESFKVLSIIIFAMHEWLIYYRHAIWGNWI